MATNSSAIQKKIETLKKGLNNKFITASQKEKIKSQVEKLESQAKASAPKKATKPAATSLTRLQKMVNKKKYGIYKGAGVDLQKDSDRPAKAIGKRTSKSGKTYYEYRANRIDVKQPPKRYPKLEKGGYMAKGAVVGEYKVIPNKRGEGNLKMYVTSDYEKSFLVNGTLMEANEAAQKFVRENNETHPTAVVTKLHPSKLPLKNKKVSYITKDEITKYEKGGMSQGYDDREDERLGMKYGKMSMKDLDSTYARRDDARFEERGKMADGGEMRLVWKRKYGFSLGEKVIINGEVDEVVGFVTSDDEENYNMGYRLILKENGTQSLGSVEKYEKGGEMAKGGKIKSFYEVVYVDKDDTKKVVAKFIDKNEAYVSANNLMRNMPKMGKTGTYVVNENTTNKFKDGGYMAKGGELAAKKRLEELREELRAERISYGELTELQELSEYIDKDDVELLEAAGVPENDEDEYGKGGKIRSQEEFNELVIKKEKLVKNLSPKEIADMWNKNSNSPSKMTEEEAKMSTSKMYLRDLLVEKELTKAEYNKYFEKGGYMAEGGRVKGRNNETGETYGVVIGSVKKSDENIEDGTEMNVRKSYSSRISEVKLVFDNNGNLYEITDYGYALEGNYPETSGGTVKTYIANKKETLEILSKKYNPAFAKKLIELAKNPKMAEGGMTEHGLRIGDKITDDMFWDNQIVVQNTKTNKRAQIDLETGKRIDEMAKGGYMAEGGVTAKEVVESNADMVLSQIKAVKHHAEELSSVVSRKSNIEAWVVGKIERASTDLSDITHYLEGNKDKMSMGGTIRHYAHKMDKK